MCHNCGASTTFYNFLEKVDQSLVKEYALERYKHGETGNNNYAKPKFEEFKTPTPVFQKNLELPNIESLPKTHFAKTYVMSRKIPKECFNRLYYAEDFKHFVESLGLEQDGLIEGDKRLVIPFYDQDKNLIAIQGRALGESKLRYITIKIDETKNKLFGLDRINQEKMVYVVEGPIDSLFIDNAVATADSHLEGASNVLEKNNITLIFDNEPRNKEICNQIDKAIDNHFNVVIWPPFIDSKDINDMILDGFSPDEIQDIISKNTFVNLRAKAEFVNWKKV